MTDFNTQAEALCLSDMHKDAYGFRPRINFNDGTWTQARFDMFVANTSEALAEEIVLGKLRDIEALAAFVAHIDKMADDYGISKRQAIRWDMQMEEAEGDVDFYFFQHGISHSDSQQFMPLIAN